MSSIDKLLIQGIRSYSPQDPSIIEFHSPLTLIVGQNGCGKTTIIEALKFVTTGEYPPSSAKGQLFVHDMKIAGEREVKARVKLRFKNTTQAEITCTRTLQLQQLRTKAQLKTLENVLTVKDPESLEKKTLTRKCADMDKEVPLHLGVSKSVLEYVIFCHQEDSNWPLSDPTKLKDKFDGIFSSTRYTKALDNIKNYRKELNLGIKGASSELDHLKIHRDKAVILQKEVEDLKNRIATSEERKTGIESDLEPLKREIRAIDESLQKITQLEYELNNVQLIANRTNHQYKEMSSKIDKVTDTDEEIQAELNNFEKEFNQVQKDIENYKKSSYKCEHEINEVNKNLQKIRDERTRLQINIREFKLEEENQKKHIEKVKANFDYDITGEIEDPSDFVKKLQDVSLNTKRSTQAYKNKRAQEQHDLNSKTNLTRDKISGLSQNQKGKQQMIAHYKKEMFKIEQKLSSLTATTAQLEEFDKKINDIKGIISTQTSDASMEVTKAELQMAEGRNKEISSKILSLQADIKTLNLQATVRAKLEHLKEKEKTLESEKENFIAKYGSELDSLLGSKCDLTNPYASRKQLSKITKGKKVTLTDYETQLEKGKRKLQSVDVLLSEEKKKKKSLTIELEEKHQALVSVIGEKEYELALSEAQTEEEKRSLRHQHMLASEKLMGKYIGVFEEEGNCYLCNRGFDTTAEKEKFKDKLLSSKQKVPAALKQTKDKHDRANEKYRRILSLQGVAQEMKEIGTHKLAKVDERINELINNQSSLKGKCDQLKTEVNELKKEIETLQESETALDKIENVFDQLDDVNSSIRTESAKLLSSGTVETMDEAVAKMEKLQEQQKEENDKMQNLKEEIQNAELKLVRTQNEMAEVENRRRKVADDLEQQRQAKEKKESLAATISKLQEEIQELKDQEVPLKEKYDKLNAESSKRSEETDNQMAIMREKISALDKDINYLTMSLDKSNRIRQSMSKKSINMISEEISTLEDLCQSAETEKNILQDNINKCKTILASRSSHKRKLEDNLELRRLKAELEKQGKKCDKLKELMKEHNKKELERQSSEFKRRQSQLVHERSALEGREDELISQRSRTERELATDLYQNAYTDYKKKLVEFQTTSFVHTDLDKFHKALDAAIVQFHQVKMEEINKIIKEMWVNTYCGSDIDTIEIRSESAIASTTGKRSYQYRVVMKRGDVEIDMKGRCSAGQKVLASLIIRLALAETFCINCGIMALDEPTSNLDRDNIENFANNLINIINNRRSQKNFQLIVITHDQEFIDYLGKADFVDSFYKIVRDDNQNSMIKQHQFR